jgi:hypothetical protein
MFLIRKQQMDALLAGAEQAFEDEVVDYIRRTVADKTAGLPLDRLRADTRRGIAKARKYGIEQSLDIQRFVELLYRIGPDLDEAPATRSWVLPLLTDRTLTAVAKLDQVEGQAVLLGFLSES